MSRVHDVNVVDTSVQETVWTLPVYVRRAARRLKDRKLWIRYWAASWFIVQTALCYRSTNSLRDVNWSWASVNIVWLAINTADCLTRLVYNLLQASAGWRRSSPSRT